MSFPYPCMSFPLALCYSRRPLCHSRAGGNPEKFIVILNLFQDLLKEMPQTCSA
ncbi:MULTISPECIES: hypothetical protein [unclassified Rickettsia]|uniref:hypothetical protein n=1 Tax=unclassified Rickettsia TaxID=114295 RepID=UPI0031332595